MTDGPYNDSIRSDTPRGIGGLWTQLNAIATGIGSLAQIASDVASIATVCNEQLPAMRASLDTLLTRMTYLTGSTAPAPNTFGAAGLPEYLTRQIASRNDVNIYSGNMYVWLVRNWEVLNIVVQALSSDQPLENANIPTLARIAEILGVGATGGVDSNLFALLRSIDTNTLRTAECCEEGNGGGGEEPPPIVAPTACSTSTPYVNNGWVQVASFQVAEPVSETIYVWRPTWTTVPNGVLSQNLTGGPCLTTPPGPSFTLCAGWASNGAGTDYPHAVDLITGFQDSGADNPNYPTFYEGVNEPGFPSGGLQVPADPSALGVGEYDIYNLVFYSRFASEPDLRVALYNSTEIPS